MRKEIRHACGHPATMPAGVMGRAERESWRRFIEKGRCNDCYAAWKRNGAAAAPTPETIAHTMGLTVDELEELDGISRNGLTNEKE